MVTSVSKIFAHDAMKEACKIARIAVRELPEIIKTFCVDFGNCETLIVVPNTPIWSIYLFLGYHGYTNCILLNPHGVIQKPLDHVTSDIKVCKCISYEDYDTNKFAGKYANNAKISTGLVDENNVIICMRTKRDALPHDGGACFFATNAFAGMSDVGGNCD